MERHGLRAPQADDRRPRCGSRCVRRGRCRASAGASAGLTPIDSPVHHQQADIADRLGATIPTTVSTTLPSRSSPRSSKRRFAASVVAQSMPAATPRRHAPVGAPRGQQGQGGVYAPPRSGASSEAPPRLRRRWPLGSADRHSCARPDARAHARTRCHGIQGQKRG